MVFVLLLVVYHIWGNLTVQTTVYEIPLDAKYSALSEFTVAQVSDLHNAMFGKEQEKLLHAIKKQQPDIITVTGDLIDSDKTDIEAAMCFIREAVKIAPVYYITGNHEAWVPSEYDILREKMISAGVSVLENKAVEIEYNEQKITCLGVHDPSFADGSTYVGDAEIINQAINEIDIASENFTLLLSHRPELFDIYAENGINLVLSGHAHGGQFRLPFIGGLVAPNQGFFPKYTSGIFSKSETYMVVSRGLGNSIIPIRIFNRPELVVVTLK